MGDSSGPHCAHLAVAYAPLEHADGSLTARWECSSCGVEFCRRRTFEELLDASSLGTPEVKEMTARVDPDAVARVLKRVDDIERRPERNRIADAVEAWAKEHKVAAWNSWADGCLDEIAAKVRAGAFKEE